MEQILFVLEKRIFPLHWNGFCSLWNKFSSQTFLVPSVTFFELDSTPTTTRTFEQSSRSKSDKGFCRQVLQSNKNNTKRIWVYDREKRQKKYNQINSLPQKTIKRPYKTLQGHTRTTRTRTTKLLLGPLSRARGQK